MGLRRCPRVWLVPGSIAPLVWAPRFRAHLFFPVRLLARLNDEGRLTLLAHELAHVRRRDHWVRWLEVVTLGLYWWLPVVWWARRHLQAAEEECCDAWVVGELPAAARSYAHAILETVDFLSEEQPALPPVASGMAQVHAIKQRLLTILRGSTPRGLSPPGRLGILTLALALLPWFPGPAESRRPPGDEGNRPGRPAGRPRPAAALEVQAFENAASLPGLGADVLAAVYCPRRHDHRRRHRRRQARALLRGRHRSRCASPSRDTTTWSRASPSRPTASGSPPPATTAPSASGTRPPASRRPS